MKKINENITNELINEKEKNNQLNYQIHNLNNEIKKIKNENIELKELIKEMKYKLIEFNNDNNGLKNEKNKKSNL